MHVPRGLPCYYLLVWQRDYSVHIVCLPISLSVCLWLCPRSWSCSTPQFWSDCSETSHTCWMWSPHCVKLFRSKVKVVGLRKVKMYLTFWSVTNSFQDRPGSKFGPPIERIVFVAVFVYIRLHISVICNSIVQLIYMGYAACETLQSLGLLLFSLVGCWYWNLIGRNVLNDVEIETAISMGKYSDWILTGTNRDSSNQHIVSDFAEHWNYK